MTKPSRGSPDASQRDRFIETARTLGCDEEEAAFKAKLAVIARQRPAPKVTIKASSGEEKSCDREG